ncbi:hypothetical protein BDZ89DRAFT_974999 [Hymenopellis radicata]|nr:hypothetical protein BDZ89DRAFT_974999 [Hymenopellis radicata]
MRQSNATRSKVKTSRTATGIKDTFQDHFITKLDEAVYKLRGETQRQDALNKAIRELPAETISPVWRIKGMCSFVFG